METILVTGAAGFIGSHLSKKLLDQGYRVIGYDNVNDYYDTRLKEDRLRLLEHESFIFIRASLEDRQSIEGVFTEYRPTIVVNLAAQAGVRYSLQNPHAYVESNIMGFLNILEASRQHDIKHLIYASSSSVYGANVKMPFSVSDPVDHPVSLYAATKKSNELMAHTYSHLYGLPTTGLRFFTVYGPWGRPDMAYFSFTKHILEGKPIKVFNYGEMRRDFTYVNDIVNGIATLLHKPPVSNDNWDRYRMDAGSSYAPYKIYNIGNNQPVDLLLFIRTIEECLGKKAELEFHPMQAGDVKETFADISDLQRDAGFSPSTPIEEGIREFVNWYRAYYKV